MNIFIISFEIFKNDYKDIKLALDISLDKLNVAVKTMLIMNHVIM